LDSPSFAFHLIEEQRLPFNVSSLQKWLQSVCLKRQIPLGDFAYIMTNDDYVLELNQKHLDHNYLTDILTFPYSYNPLEAEIYISLDRVMDNANSLSISYSDEVLRVIAHGLLHMLGYKDSSDIEKKEMRAAEDEMIHQFLDAYV